MATFYWYGGSGDLGHPNNWSEDPPVVDPTTGEIIPQVPGPGDDANIDGGGTLTGSADFQNGYVSESFGLDGSLNGGLVQVNGDLSVQSGGSVVGYTVVYGSLSIESG